MPSRPLVQGYHSMVTRSAAAGAGCPCGSCRRHAYHGAGTRVGTPPGASEVALPIPGAELAQPALARFNRLVAGRIALIGFGAIGQVVASEVDVAAVLVRDRYLESARRALPGVAVVASIGRIEASGRLGTLTVEMAGRAAPDNPKTSQVTAYSIVHAPGSSPPSRAPRTPSETPPSAGSAAAGRTRRGHHDLSQKS